MKKWIFGVALAVVVTGLGALGLGVSAHAASSIPASPKYVALGDSVAAGAGLPLSYNASSEDVLCARSSAAYPYLLAAKLNTSVTNLACSGAKVSDGLYDSQVVNGTSLTPQLEQAFAGGNPELITMTIGANDVQWTSFIGKCYVSTCGTTRDSLLAGIYDTSLQGKLLYTLHRIKDLSGSHTPPQVLISGYYNPITSTGCLGSDVVTPNELTWINKQTSNLNRAISQVVTGTSKVSSLFKGNYTFAKFVPVDFSNHGLCSSNPWVQSLTASAPLHPTAAGQAQFANEFYRATR